MGYKMSELNGIDQSLVTRLHAAGIETTTDMMKAWIDPVMRAKVLASAGLDEDQLKRMASMARMARRRGIGPKYADTLVSAGVIGKKSLAKHTPEGLVKHLARVNAEGKSTRPLPTLREVESWFASLK